MITLDGIEVKVGDRLWNVLYGWGKVSYIIAEDTLIWFGDYCATAFNINEGQAHLINRTLFWDELKFEIPKPPKKMVEKWRWVVKPLHGDIYISDFHYSESTERGCVYTAEELIQKIDSTRIEVEE